MYTWQIILQNQFVAIVSVSIDGQIGLVTEFPIIFYIPWFYEIWD